MGARQQGWEKSPPSPESMQAAAGVGCSTEVPLKTCRSSQCPPQCSPAPHSTIPVPPSIAYRPLITSQCPQCCLETPRSLPVPPSTTKTPPQCPPGVPQHLTVQSRCPPVLPRALPVSPSANLSHTNPVLPSIASSPQSAPQSSPTSPSAFCAPYCHRETPSSPPSALQQHPEPPGTLPVPSGRWKTSPPGTKQGDGGIGGGEGDRDAK